MRLFKALAVIAAFTLSAGAAQGQVLVGDAESRDYRGTDAAKVAEKERNAAIEATKAPKAVRGNRAVPATPDDVTVGSEIRDAKGLVLGKVDSVSLSAAVVAAEGGKVEVPLESFGKNNKGLLLSLTKTEFDAIVAGANKPAN